MKRAALIVSILLLTGCAAAPAPAPVPEPVAIEASDIQTMDDGIAWARGLTSDVSAEELSAGINAVGDLVPEQDIWFQDNNEIGGALITLNSDVLADPDNAGSKVDDLNDIIDDLEASIEKGPTP